MSLSVGIVGLPNAGKSTLLNALTRSHTAAVASYPFCTIEPNKAVVAVPDERLTRVAAIVQPKSIVPATVQFVDIAGLVRGASKGEGLGNRFLSHVRDADAILHVVRCFTDENVAHVEGTADPARDIGIVETELLLADFETVADVAHRLSKQARAEPALRHEVAALERLRDHIGKGLPAATFGEKLDETTAAAVREMRLLTLKPVIYCANADEASLGPDSAAVRAVGEAAAARQAPAVTVCSKMEEELAEMSSSERAEFLAAYGIREGGLEQTIRTGYAALGLISFFTTLSSECRAWTVRRGTRAPQAAGTIHTDFERGFIRAHVMAWQDFVAHGGEAGCRHLGLMKEEGRDYEVRDGDVIHFLFST